jgi:hypothetical protein
MEKKEDLNDELTGSGISPSSKSCSKTKPAAGARCDLSWLNDAAVRIPQWKHPNAQKHGAFSMCPIIPGEDPREFQELHSALIDEWQPSGPTEEDVVLSIADLMWRKRRAQRSLGAKLIKSTLDPRSPAFDEWRGLNVFIYRLRSEPETAFGQWASRLLTADTVNHLKQKFPRSNYHSTSEWSEAVITEIKSVLLPAASPSLGATEPREGDWPEPLHRFLVELKVGESIQNAKEDFEADLNLRERLDAMIHRQVKHLTQLKAWKEMLRQSSAARDDEQPKRITARNGL